MDILPVMDLQRGRVVRGVAGQRHAYQPVESVLATDAAPQAIALGLRDQLGLRAAYLADLDAIAGGEPAWDAYGDLLACGMDLWVDAGLADAGRAKAVAEFQHKHRPLARLIAGLESLAGPESLRQVLAAAGPRLVFSLDLMQGRPWTTSAGWQGMESLEVVRLAWETGVRTLIVLDVATVGTNGGPSTLALCAQIASRWPQLELIAGGGIRSAADLAAFARAGCSAVLVASALHDGRLGRTDIENWAGR